MRFQVLRFGFDCFRIDRDSNIMRNRIAKIFLDVFNLEARSNGSMDPLSKILELSADERAAMGLLHTAQEISQQPDTWWRTFEKATQRQPELWSFLKRAGIYNDLRSRPSVFLVGAGTSDYIGRSVATVLRRAWQCDVCAVPSTDLLICSDDLLINGKGYLWISFSRSGDSSEGVAVLESALERHPDIYHLIVCCNAGGRMARIGANAANVCRLILNDEVNDQGLAMTSSFSNMVVAGHCLANLQDLDSYALTVRSLIGTARKLLPQAAQLASQYVAEKFSKICFLGTGPLHAVAVESALKVLELTAGRIVTLSESFLGVRHGPLSAIDNDTIIVAFVSHEPKRRSYELDLLEEVTAKQLAKNIVLVASAVELDKKRLAKLGLILTLDDKVADCYRPPADVLVGQLFGLFASIGLGLKPDSPSPQGAISRVVSQVRIY